MDRRHGLLLRPSPRSRLLCMKDMQTPVARMLRGAAPKQRYYSLQLIHFWSISQGVAGEHCQTRPKYYVNRPWTLLTSAAGAKSVRRYPLPTRSEEAYICRVYHPRL